MTYSPKTAVIADVHGNTPALEAVLSDIVSHGIKKIYFLGDIINGMDPLGSLRLLRDWGDVVCVQGNAELYLLTPDWDDFPRKEEDLYRGLFEILGWWKALIPADYLNWIESWPIIHSENGACFVHDSPVDRLAPEEWHEDGIDQKYKELMHHYHGVTPKLPDDKLSRLKSVMRRHSYTQVFAGHTHEPFVRVLDGLTICNAGSVGFNLDADPLAAWVSVEGPIGGDCRVTVHRIPYDIEQAIALVDAASDYPSFSQPHRMQSYKQMIRTGTHWRYHMPSR